MRFGTKLSKNFATFIQRQFGLDMYMDKAGHAMTSYYVGLVGIETMKWSGMKSKNAANWWIARLSLFNRRRNPRWDICRQGFSWGDMAANTGGLC